MKSILAKLLTLISVIGLCATAIADPRIEEVWTCQIKDGKTMDDVRAANSKWVKFINANIEGGDITSHIVTNVVGNATMGRFLYVDSFPVLESWSAAKGASDGNEEGEGIDEELAEAADCSENRLYESEKS